MTYLHTRECKGIPTKAYFAMEYNGVSGKCQETMARKVEQDGAHGSNACGMCGVEVGMHAME